MKFLHPKKVEIISNLDALLTKAFVCNLIPLIPLQLIDLPIIIVLKLTDAN